MRDKILLIGGGGHCKSVIDSIDKSKYDIAGILDLKEKVGECISKIEIIGTDDDMKIYFDRGIKNAFITLGSIGNSDNREVIYQKLKNIGFELPNIIDKTAILSDDINMGEGCYIGKGTIVNVDSNIGNCVILNTGSIVEHECSIGDFVHIAPASTLSGNVVLERGVHIGTQSTIIQNIQIGRDTLIGAGSVVVNSIGPNKKAYGVPCRVVSK